MTLPPLVLDASATVAAIFGRQPAIPLGDYELIAPMLWWFETRNAVLVRIRSEDQPVAVAGPLLDALDDLGVDLYPPGLLDSALLPLAMRHRLSAYDASYLLLAHVADASIATLDTKLAKAAEAEGLEVVGM